MEVMNFSEIEDELIRRVYADWVIETVDRLQRPR